MPDGLADQLTRQELVDLVRFMSELGKVGGPYAPNKARLVRRWQVFEPTNENMNQIQPGPGGRGGREPGRVRLVERRTRRRNGEFPLDSLPKLVVWKDSEPFGMVRAQLDVTTGGPVKLKINGDDGPDLVGRGDAGGSQGRDGAGLEARASSDDVLGGLEQAEGRLAGRAGGRGRLAGAGEHREWQVMASVAA